MKFVKKFESILENDELKRMFFDELENWSGDIDIASDIVAEIYVLSKITDDKNSTEYKEKYDEIKNFLMNH